MSSGLILVQDTSLSTAMLTSGNRAVSSLIDADFLEKITFSSSPVWLPVLKSNYSDKYQTIVVLTFKNGIEAQAQVSFYDKNAT